jgi:hypothetical protein
MKCPRCQIENPIAAPDLSRCTNKMIYDEQTAFSSINELGDGLVNRFKEEI